MIVLFPDRIFMLSISCVSLLIFISVAVKFSKNLIFLKFIIFCVKSDFELNFSILDGQK